MALIPYLLDDVVPRRHLRDSLLSNIFDDDDFIVSRPSITLRKYLRPWKNLAAAARDVGSTIKSDKDKFQVNLDVQHFDPDEISVKTADGYIVVEGKHEEKEDDHGFVTRQFKRRYALPDDCNPETVDSRLSSDGVLTVTAPRATAGVREERAVPITHTGPVRRKALEDEVNGEIENKEEKSPQKKRRR